MIDERAATVGFFTEIAAEYTDAPILAELLPMEAGKVRAVVFDDGASWRILAHEAMPAHKLFFVLFHELGHIVAGDIERVDGLLLEHIRAAILGAGAAFPAAFRHVVDAERTGDDWRHEIEIDEWAEVEAEKHWPALKRRLDETWQAYCRGGFTHG